MAKSKRAKATGITTKEAYKVYDRDKYNENSCLFCELEYEMRGQDYFSRSIHDLMHFIPRSSGGLGVAENLVLGCRYHHQLLDNGNRGKRQEMLSMMETYLKSKYPDWDKDKLVYNKYAEAVNE